VSDAHTYVHALMHEHTQPMTPLYNRMKIIYTC